MPGSQAREKGTHVWTPQRCRNTALTVVIFVSFSVLPTTQISLCREKRCHETIILTVALKAGEMKTQITILSLASKMAMPPYASARVCVIFSIAKSAVSDMQVAAVTQPDCLVMEFAFLPLILPSCRYKHPLLFTVPISTPFHPSFKFPSSTKTVERKLTATTSIRNLCPYVSSYQVIFLLRLLWIALYM